MDTYDYDFPTGDQDWQNETTIEWFEVSDHHGSHINIIGRVNNNGYESFIYENGELIPQCQFLEEIKRDMLSIPDYIKP